MSDGGVVSPELIAKATDFADDLTDRLGRVIDTSARLSALALNDRVTVSLVEDDEFAAIPLTIGRKHRLDLFLKFNCCWDSATQFLAVEESWVHVTAKGDKAPLFRYEYVRTARGIPSAHLHVHAHRDEFTHFLATAARGKPGRRQRKDEIPRLAKFHFPLGGHRFRPCMEDVLQALVVEFEIDRVQGWESAIGEGREQWRRFQLKAAVRDAPGEAAEVLDDLGWKTSAPDDHPADNVERLRSY